MSNEAPRVGMELNVTDFGECSFFRGEFINFLNWDTLMTDGTTLMECIENAELTTQDQDGGEGPSVQLNDLNEALRVRFISRIRDEFERQTDRRRIL